MRSPLFDGCSQTNFTTFFASAAVAARFTQGLYEDCCLSHAGLRYHHQEGKEPLTQGDLGRGDRSNGNGSWVGIAVIIRPLGDLDTSSIFVK